MRKVVVAAVTVMHPLSHAIMVRKGQQISDKMIRRLGAQGVDVLTVNGPERVTADGWHVCGPWSVFLQLDHFSR